MSRRWLYGATSVEGSQSPRYAAWAERADQHARAGSKEQVQADLALSHRDLSQGELASTLRRRELAWESADRFGDAELLAAAASPVIRQLGILPRLYLKRLHLVEEVSKRSWDDTTPVTRVDLLLTVGDMNLA